MKIEMREGNLIEAKERIILHGCNAQGKMNSGVAKDIRETFPLNFLTYIEEYEKGALHLGRVIICTERAKWIINGITQQDYGYTGEKFVSYDAVKSVIIATDAVAQALGQDRVAMPMIGAGRGGGDWQTIQEIIEKHSISFTPAVYFLPDQYRMDRENETKGFIE